MEGAWRCLIRNLVTYWSLWI